MKISLRLMMCIILFFAEVAELLQLMGKLKGGMDINYHTDSFYMYMASIHLNGRIICSGTVMSLKHILTAAQCIADLIQSNDTSQFANYFAIVVTANINIVSEPYSFQQVEVHPDYNFFIRPPNYNVAVITLTMNIEFGAEFIPLQDPTENERYDRNRLVPGWIADDFLFGRVPSFKLLKYIEVEVRSIKNAPECMTNNWFPTHNLYCGFATGNGYLEKTDIGGPIMNKNTLRLRGIVSHIPEGENLYTIFIRLHPVMSWVKDAMANNQHKSKCRKMLTRTEINSRASTYQAVDTELRL